MRFIQLFAMPAFLTLVISTMPACFSEDFDLESSPPSPDWVGDCSDCADEEWAEDDECLELFDSVERASRIYDFDLDAFIDMVDDGDYEEARELLEDAGIDFDDETFELKIDEILSCLDSDGDDDDDDWADDEADGSGGGGHDGSGDEEDEDEDDADGGDVGDEDEEEDADEDAADGSDDEGSDCD